MPDIRFDALTETTANLNGDRFQGRIAYDTTLSRWVVCYDGTNWAVHARRDVAETFAAGITLTTGNINAVAGAIQTAGVTRISNGGAGTFTDLTDTSLTALRVVRSGTGGVLTDDAGLTTTQTSGVTRNLGLGDYSVAGDVYYTARQTSGLGAGVAINDSAQDRRWTMGIQSGGVTLRLGRWTNSGVKIDDPVTVDAGSAGLITIGGSSNSTTNFTGAIQTSGVTRISSAGAGTLTTLSTTGLATLQSVNISGLTASRMLSLDASKNVVSLDAAGARALIGAASSAGSVAYETLFTGRRTTAVTNGVMTTSVIPTKTFAANFWTAGKMVEGRAIFFTAHTANLEIKLSGNQVANFTIPNVFRGQIRVWVTCETAGASGTFSFHAQADWASTSTAGSQSPTFGDSQTAGTAWSYSWTVDTTATTTLSWEVTPTYTEDWYAVHGSLITYTP